MTTYSVGVHVRPASVDAWVLDLPGCRTIGRDRAESMALLPVVVGEYLAWLRGHGMDVDPGAPADFKVVEEVKSELEFCFAADGEPLSSDDLGPVLRLTDYAAEDLLTLYSRLPDVVLDWRPPESAVKIDNIFPDVRSIRENVGARYRFGRLLRAQPGCAECLDPTCAGCCRSGRLTPGRQRKATRPYRRRAR